MDGFTKLPKMQHFKEGGSVQREVKNFTKRDRKSVEEADTKQDKKIVKKAFGMHDSQQHDGEKTDLTALKKGGRAKKKEGTVKKFCGGGNAYKEGGSVTNVYEAKKSSGDLDNIKKTKAIKPGKADAPSKAAKKPNFKGSDVKKTNKMSSGSTKAKEVSARPKAAAAPSGAKGGVQKFQVGGSVLQDIMQAKELDRLKNAKKLGPAQQAQFAASEMNQTPAMTGLANAGMAGGLANTSPAMQAPGGVSPAGAIPMQKRGGKVKKYATGGSIDDDVRSRAMKWIEAGSPPQNQDNAETPTKSAPKKAETKLYMPDMTIEEAERQNTEYENKRESERLARRYPEKRSPGNMVRDEAEIAQRPSLETKGNRLLKSTGTRLTFNCGGKVKKMNTGGTAS